MFVCMHLLYKLVAAMSQIMVMVGLAAISDVWSGGGGGGGGEAALYLQLPPSPKAFLLFISCCSWNCLE